MKFQRGWILRNHGEDVEEHDLFKGAEAKEQLNEDVEANEILTDVEITEQRRKERLILSSSEEDEELMCAKS